MRGSVNSRVVPNEIRGEGACHWPRYGLLYKLALASDRQLDRLKRNNSIGVLEWWINHSMPCTVQEITEQLMFLLEGVIRLTKEHERHFCA